MLTIAYKITPSEEHHRLGPNYSLKILGFDNSSVLPNPLPNNFEAELLGREDLDYLVNSKEWLVLSNRVIDVILNHNPNWTCHRIPIVIGGHKSNWCVIISMEPTEAMDFERSDWDLADEDDDISYPNNVEYINVLCLRSDVELPPVFQIPEDEGVFVNPQTKDLLEANRIVGVDFEAIF